MFFFVCGVLLFIEGCEEDKVPTLTTVAVSDIKPQSATSGGIITDDGNSDIIVRGVCWSTKKSPKAEGTRTTDGYGTGTFVSNVNNLAANTVYYLRAYATNAIGTAYGNEITFTTSQITVPSITTASITGITQTSAVSGGNISSDGGAEVTDRGICWSIDANPTTDDSKISNGTGTGNFSCNISGLSGNTIYRVRAYATNSIGTSYGNEIAFSTSPMLPVVITADPSPQSTTSALGGGTISDDGGSAVVERGVCWSTTLNPTVTDSKTSDEAGTGSYESNITGLSVNTPYHVRAYATNGVGTAYGTDKTFTTDPATIKDYDNNTYDVIRIGTQLWIKENLKTTKFKNGSAIPLVSDFSGWSALTTPGYCIYDNDAGNAATYGALYNWATVETGNLCPAGWHVPSDDEFLTLDRFLGGESPAGGKMKEAGITHWIAPNTGATNESEFTALPGGYRLVNGQYNDITTNGYWWSSSEYTSQDAWHKKIQYNSDKTYRDVEKKNMGMSVRCLKD